MLRKSRKVVTTLSLSESVVDALDETAYQRRLSRSALADEVLRHGLAVVVETPDQEPEEIIAEPNVKLGLPKTLQEIRELGAVAEIDIRDYFKYAEQEGSLNPLQCDKICQLIALACADLQFRHQPTANFLSAQMTLLRKFSLSSIPIMRGEIKRMHGQLQEIVEKADFQKPRQEQEQQSSFVPADTDEEDWSVIDEAIKAARDQAHETITEKDIFQAIDGKVTTQRIVELLEANGFVVQRTESGLAYYI